MVNYRRNKLDSVDAAYFLTLVTKDRKWVFKDREDYLELWYSMEFLREKYSVEFLAWVFIRDHLHWIIQPGNADYSKVVLSFKRGTGLRFKNKGVLGKGEVLWQDRFWEHTLRDDQDYERHVDYIHINPVKHGLVKAPIEWPYSTFRLFLKDGLYPENWAADDNITVPGEVYD